ncbi:outer membrane lipoprotein chaperone LolA [Marinicella meishanensis]|uniref:outer membrane lipoprotein chaperone LolA n=1 Tax=Marinicella meishanensis TaxID=2873263 RepID=UPI001CBF2E9D|nr:outer membrane lipoprotein chaperone LolA [Marinicella sp. NBU2979]
MKKISTFLLLLSLSAPWAWAQTNEANTEAQKQPDPQQLLADLRADLTGLSAQFVQYELGSQGEQIDPNSGMVWMQSPAQFRWHYLQPIEQLIVADGDNVWVYDEDLEQVTVKQQDNELNPIYVIINDEKSQQHYDIRYETQEAGHDWISLTPKNRSEDVKTVWLALADDVVKQIKVHNHFDQTMVFEFTEIKRNPDLTGGLFQFVPPEGVDVIKAVDE